MTARDLIKASLRKLGVLASGEEPTAAEATDCLYALNHLIDSWRNERLMVYQIAPFTFPLVAGKAKYTVGPSGDFDMARPFRVEKAQLGYQGAGSSQMMNLPIDLIDQDQYQRIILPQTASEIPTCAYLDGGMPLRNLYLYTVPSVVSQITLFPWLQLATVESLDAVFSLPPGYERALIYGLAIEVAPEFGTSPSAEVVSSGQNAKAGIESVNNQAPLMRVDRALISGGGYYNILTDQ